MDLEHHYRHKQRAFDAFCKRTIRNESANAFRQVRVQQDRFVSLRRGYGQNGNPCLAVDEEIRRRIETKLIVAILSFDLN